MIKDTETSENLFAGFSKLGELAQLQILEISSSESVWLAVDLVTKILGKSKRTILRLIAKGTLPEKNVKEYRIDPQFLDDLAS